MIARLEDAGRTLIALPGKGCYPAQIGSSWPAVVHDMAEAYGYGEAEIRPPVPSAKAISGMDEAFAWVGLIDERLTHHRKIVLMRAMVHPISDRHLFSWRRIGRLFNWHHETVRTWHAVGIDRIVAVVNGTMR